MEFYKNYSHEFKTHGELDEENYRARISGEYEIQGWKKPNYFIDYKKTIIWLHTSEEYIEELEDLKNYDTILFYKHNYSSDSAKKQQTEFLENNSEGNCAYMQIHERDGISKLIKKVLNENGFNAVSLEKGRIEILKASKNKQPCISNDLLSKYCQNIGFDNNNLFLKRKTIPCLDDYTQLELKNPNLIPIINNEEYGDRLSHAFDLDFISPRMLFPLARIGNKITVGDLDILTKRVYKNRADENVTEQQIKDKYQQFISFLDDLMKDNSEWVKLRGSEFNPKLPD